MTINEQPPSISDTWTIFVDESSSSSGSGAFIILEKGEGLIIEVSLVLSFPTLNNKEEYEAFLVKSRLAKDVGPWEGDVYTDS